MWIGDDRLLQVFLHPRPTTAVGCNELDLDARSVFGRPLNRLLVHDIRLVALGVDAKVNLKSRPPLGGLARDNHWLAGG